MATICLGHHLSRLCERSDPRFDVHRLDRAVATPPSASLQQSGPFAHPPSSARAPSRDLSSVAQGARERRARGRSRARGRRAAPPEYRGDAARCDNDGDTRLHCSTWDVTQARVLRRARTAQIKHILPVRKRRRARRAAVLRAATEGGPRARIRSLQAVLMLPHEQRQLVQRWSAPVLQQQ